MLKSLLILIDNGMLKSLPIIFGNAIVAIF